VAPIWDLEIMQSAARHQQPRAFERIYP